MKNYNYYNLWKKSLAFLSCTVITIADVISFKGLFLCWYNKYIFFKRAIYNFIKASINNLIPRIVSLIEVVLELVLALFAVAYIIVTDKKTLAFIIFILFFILPLFSINYISLNQGFSCFPLMLYSGESKNFYFFIFLLIIIIFIISISSFIKNSFFNSNFYLNILIPFYKKNRAFFKLKNYYFFYFDKTDIFILLYIVLLIVFFPLMSSILDGSLIEVVTSLNIQVLLSVFISLIVICIGFFVKGIQEMFNLLYLYLYTVINIIPYICFVFFFFWIIVEPSFEDIINIMLIFRKYRLYFIMLISFIFIITNNVKGFYNILIIISLGNILSIFTIFVFDVIYQDVYTILAAKPSSINKPNNLIVSGLGGRWENLYREAVVEYKAILIENNKQLKEPLNTSIIGYLKNMANQTLSFFLASANMDGFLNLFLPPNLQMDNIRFNAFFENFLKEKGLLKEVSTTNNLSLTKLDVWKLIAPMFTSAQLNFFYPPKIQGLIEVVPMHQKIVVSNGIDYCVTLDRELNSGKLWITSSRIADGLTNTKCLTLSELVSWKVNSSIGNDKSFFRSRMQSNSTAFKGSIQLIKSGKPDLANLDMVEEKSAGTIPINSNWAVEKAADVFCKNIIYTDSSISHPKIGIAKNPSVSMGLRGGGYSSSNIRVNDLSTNGSSSKSDKIIYDDTMSGALAEGEEWQEMVEWIDPALYYTGTLIDGRPIIDPFDSYDFVRGEESNLDYENNGSNALSSNRDSNNTNNQMQNEPIDIVENESIVFEALDEGLEEIYVGDYPSPGIDGGDESEDCPDDLQDSAQQVKQLVEAQSDSEDNITLSSYDSEDFIPIWESDFAIKEFKSFLNSVTNEELFSNEFCKEFSGDFHSLEEISSIVINENLEESSHGGLHLTLSGLVSISKSEISNLIKESRTNKFINTTSYAENKVKKTYKGDSYSYTKRKLNNAKRIFNRSLRAEKFADLSNIKKEELTSKFNAEHAKLKDGLNENKDSHEFLMNLSVTIEGLVSNILNNSTHIRWENRDIYKRVLSLQRYINNIKFRVNDSINTSNLDNNTKDILLKQVNEIVTNLHAGFSIGNQIDLVYIDELENKIKDTAGKLVKKSNLIFRDTIKVLARNQFLSGNFYPTTKNSFLIADFHRCIRDEIVAVSKKRLYARIKSAENKGLIENPKLVNSELTGEFEFLKKNLYTMPNLQVICLHLLEVVVKLNKKYYYPCNMKYAYNNFNYSLYTKLKEIIIRFIEKYKYNK